MRVDPARCVASGGAILTLSRTAAWTLACLLPAMRLHAAGTNLLTGTSRAPVREFGATSAPGGGTWLDRLGAGVGGFVSSSPYEGVGYEVRAIPVVTYIGERLVVTGPGATWLLGRTFDPATVSLGLNWEFPGPRITDSPIVRNGPYFAAFGSVTWRF